MTKYIMINQSVKLRYKNLFHYGWRVPASSFVLLLAFLLDLISIPFLWSDWYYANVTFNTYKFFNHVLNKLLYGG